MKKDNYSDENGNYSIRSLYFDDIRNSSLFEKQSGILARKKYRIRIYNLNENIIKLEKKSRIGHFINKQTALKVRDEGRVTASLWSFDDKIEIPWSDVSISDVSITPDDFYPRGRTALLDCIGTHLSQTLQ